MKKIILSILLLISFTFSNEIFAQLSPPTLLLPPNNATGVSTTPLFDWTDVSGATSYRVQVIQGITTVIDHGNLSVSQYQVLPSEALNSFTSYYWRAAAVNGSDTAWSGYFTFETNVSAPPPPVLTQPPDNETNVSTTPTFVWQPSSGATSYQLQVAINPNFNPPSIDVPGLTSTQYVVTQSQELAHGTGYYWRVRASNSGGTSNWSTVFSFSTTPAPPPPPTLQQPPNNATNITLTPTLDWTDVFGATGYHVYVSTSVNFSTLIVDETVTPSQYNVPTGLLSGFTQYFWKVASVNMGGEGDPSTVFNFTTMIGPPAAPLLQAPPNGDTTVSRFPLFDWSDVPNASSYTLQVATDPGFNSLVFQQNSNISQFQVTAALLQNNTVYYWRVNASNSGGTSSWSTTWNFRTVPSAPPPPTLISPPNGATGITLTPTLQWSDSPGATSYQVQVATNTNFNSPVVDQPTTISEYEIPPGRLIGNTLYYWRVRAHNNGGYSNWSTVWNFRTLQTLTASLKVLLEGFYNGSTQVQDTIRVYLADASAPHTFRDSSLTFLSTSGTGTTSFQRAPNGSYYIVIKHRNHLETWSSLPQTFTTGNLVNYDFTTASNKAYGNNMKQVGSVWVFWGGDINQDGNVDLNDYFAYVPQFGHDAYISADLNGDTYADGYDLPILYGNFGKSKARP